MTEHRISVPVDATLFNRVQDNIPDGMRSALVRSILERILGAVEQHGVAVVGEIISGEYELTPLPHTDVRKLDTSEEVA